MTLVSILISIGLAVGPPLIYAEQAYRMQERRNSSGFSKDVCAVLLISNIARIVWWFPTRYELPLLIQSILMVFAQVGLLYLSLLYRPGSFASSAFSVSSNDAQRRDVLFEAEPPGSGVPREARTPTTQPETQPQFQVRVDPPPEEAEEGEGHHAPSHIPQREEETASGRQQPRTNGVPSLSVNTLELPEIIESNRPFGFWTWPDFASYIWTLLIVTAVLGILQLLLGWSSFYNTLLGFFALGLESMLPIPQLIQNHQRQSLAGFQMTVLAGWTFGDAFKSIYYLVKSAPMQFTIFGLFQLTVDLGICAQAYLYRDKTARETAEMKSQQQNLASLRRAERGEGEEELESSGRRTTQRPSTVQNGSPARAAAPIHDTSPESAPFALGDIEADEEEESKTLKGNR